MSHYSDDPAMVRVDFWKPSGKWYDTEAVKWIGNGFTVDAPLIHDQFKESLRQHLGDRLSEMDATCLHPYHKNSHPIQIKAGGWNND